MSGELHSENAEKAVLSSMLQAPAEVIPQLLTTFGDRKVFYSPGRWSMPWGKRGSWNKSAGRLSWPRS